jgi:hypothetical protein
MFDEGKNYCKTCDFTYTCRNHLLCHLRQMHHFSMSVSQRKIVDSSILPNANKDSIYNCRLCQKTYPKYRKYRIHLYNAHNTKVGRAAKVRRPDITPNINDSNFYCAACERRFTTRSYYWSHLARVHKMSLPTKNVIKNPDLLPDIKDLNAKHAKRLQAIKETTCHTCLLFTI